jgi:hypothetical protein
VRLPFTDGHYSATLDALTSKIDPSVIPVSIIVEMTTYCLRRCVPRRYGVQVTLNNGV